MILTIYADILYSYVYVMYYFRIVDGLGEILSETILF